MTRRNFSKFRDTFMDESVSQRKMPENLMLSKREQGIMLKSSFIVVSGILIFLVAVFIQIVVL